MSSSIDRALSLSLSLFGLSLLILFSLADVLRRRDIKMEYRKNMSRSTYTLPTIIPLLVPCVSQAIVRICIKKKCKK